MAYQTIEVRFKRTGESIEVPISSESTVQYIIKYACEHSIRKAEIDYENYYLILLNNQEMLDNDNMLKETKALTVEYPVLQLCMKTVIREQIMDLARRNLSKNQDERIATLQTQIVTTKSRDIAINNDRPPTSSSQTDASNESVVDQSKIKSGTGSTSASVAISTDLNLNISFPDAIPPPCVQFTQEEVNWRTLATVSSDNAQNSSLSEKLANTYQHVTSKIFEVGTAVTRDSVLRRDISNAYKEINIVLCGSARVGKSTLVNAICQQKLAKTSAGLDSCTSMMSRYVLRGEIEIDSEAISYQYNFWDTPGFESWTKDKIRKRLDGILKEPKSDILCMIYCASPGSYANLQQLRWLLDECIEIDSEAISYQYNFWDTPGFESWTKDKIRKRLEGILKEPKSDILCMIYCASPGSYANLQQLRWLLDECMKKQIFCALVCTNKWAGQKPQRDAVMEDFQNLLEHYHKRTREENGVVYFGNMGLCTAVNSQRFVDEDSGKEFEQSGINELIFGIMESLDDEKVAQWCTVVFNNKSFWAHLFKLPKQLKTFWNRLIGKT
ncbi:unnamed protein product [Rotaria magnacalcarata]|uniref:G domain-containing protein n=2 Tax=Rotaria magnacalcarata TaxID=392030 RepID=A0A815PIJ1_9BILA|nr:unnamed protein product [Rotaria magnacalcarata]